MCTLELFPGSMVYHLIFLHAPVGMIPSDIGLQETLEFLPNWEKYAISLGLSIEKVKSCKGLPQGDMGGLLALKHWRDGKCGSGYPGTWKFLIGVIKDCLGPNVAEDLKKKVIAKKMWTCTNQAGGFSALYITAFCGV